MQTCGRSFGMAIAIHAIVRAPLAPFSDAGGMAVCGIESRGFLPGGAAALELGVGFVAARKAGGMFRGEKLARKTEPDHRGIRHSLRIQRASLDQGDRVLLVDDWIETGSQALAVWDLLSAVKNFQTLDRVVPALHRLRRLTSAA